MVDIHHHIARMSKEEKIAELRTYFQHGGLHMVDMDKIVADQQRLGLPDSVFDEALHKLAISTGLMFGKPPMTAGEFEYHAKQRGKVHFNHHGLRLPHK